jgi:SAM-dependent methyltransferase
MASLKKLLFDLFFDHQDLFQALFVMEKEIDLALFPLEIQPFLSANILQKINQKIKSNFRISKVNNVFIVTDFPTYFGSDRVWYLLEDESLFFAKNIPDCTDKKALDIGTGSGVLAIMASLQGAKHVTAIDISPRAIAFGTFNASLNNCNNITFKAEGLENHEPNSAYDFITLNPPFVPMPSTTKYMLSGKGGMDGLGLIHAFFNQIDALTHPETRINIISMSPGDAYISALEKLFIDRCIGKAMKIQSTDLYGTTAPIEVIFQPFKKMSLTTWKKWLKTKNYTHMHYLFIQTSPSESYEYSRKALFPKLEDLPDSGTWRAMYKVIQNSKDHAS